MRKTLWGPTGVDTCRVTLQLVLLHSQRHTLLIFAAAARSRLMLQTKTYARQFPQKFAAGSAREPAAAGLLLVLPLLMLAAAAADARCCLAAVSSGCKVQQDHTHVPFTVGAALCLRPTPVLP